MLKLSNGDLLMQLYYVTSQTYSIRSPEELQRKYSHRPQITSCLSNFQVAILISGTLRIFKIANYSRTTF